MSSTLPTFRTALKTALDGHATITSAEVAVFKYLMPDLPSEQFIEMTRATLQNTWQAQGKKMEQYDLRVNVWSLVSGSEEVDTSIDNAATQAETNALSYCDAIAELLLADKTLGGVVDHAEWQGGTVDNQLNDKGRWCLVEGHIMVKAFGV
jgi:hypothetical protein